jgi:hypothetical protein
VVAEAMFAIAYEFQFVERDNDDCKRAAWPTMCFLLWRYKASHSLASSFSSTPCCLDGIPKRKNQKGMLWLLCSTQNAYFSSNDCVQPRATKIICLLEM